MWRALRQLGTVHGRLGWEWRHPYSASCAWFSDKSKYSLYVSLSPAGTGPDALWHNHLALSPLWGSQRMREKRTWPLATPGHPCFSSAHPFHPVVLNMWDQGHLGSVSLGNLLEIQVLGAALDLLNQKLLEWAQKTSFLPSPSGVPDASSIWESLLWEVL